MGCSPSKGTNLGSFGTMRKGRMLPPVPQESQIEEDRVKNNVTGLAKGDPKGNKESPHVQVSQKETQMTPQKKRPVTEEVSMGGMNIDKVECMVIENVTLPLRKEKNIDKQELADKKTNRKPKKAVKGTKGPKRKDKDKNQISTDQKVDFPEPLVKAHQAAYAFLNPSINKYDSVLGLIEQATQTQISVQPMVAFMALRYEEIIQGLEEMAEEGERVFKENGEHLAWPSQMENLSSSSHRKSGLAGTESPPDLLQQLLQYTTQRMRNVSRTVGGIGDSALEEAVDYFASVSELLEEKLKIKRTVEARLMRLLTRIEMASLRKPGAEDSALFSEDSGIGAENESLNGCEKHHRRESCGSTGANRSPVSPIEYTSMNITRASGEKYGTQISPSVSLTSLNSIDSTCTLMDNDQRDSLLGLASLDDGADENNDEKERDKGVDDRKVAFKLRSNSSLVSCKTPPLRLPTKRIENPQNVEMTLKIKNAISGRIQFVQKQNTCAKAKVAGTPKTSRQDWTDEEVQSPRRPQTAAAVRRAEIKKNPVTRGQRSRSAESLRSKGEDPTLFELERTQKALNQRLQRMSKSKVGANSKPITFKKTEGNPPAQSPTINRKQLPQGRSINSQPPKDKASLSRCNNKKEKQLVDVEDDQWQEKITPKCLIKATPPTSPPLSPQCSGFHRGRNSVKKLINTFSQGIEVRESPKVLGALKGVQRCGVPILPGLGNVEAVLSTGVTSCRPESTSEKNDYFDLDSLPPPPLEVLMDTSFESAQSGLTAAGDEATKVGKSSVLKRAAVSQRLRASVQTVTVLPSKGGLPQSSKIASPGTTAFSKVTQPDVQPHLEMRTDSLHQQVRKILHLQKSSDSNSERSSMSWVATSKDQGESLDVQHYGHISVPQPNTVPPSSVASSQPLATPPVSKGRMLPSTPSTPNSLHRRLPSPLGSKQETTTPSTDRPPVNRTPSIPPALQLRLPSPPVARQNSYTSYPFKAPSPPASPKVQKWSRENSSDESSSARMFSNARSVFCPVSPSMFEAQPCSVPQPPQAWTSTRASVFSSYWGSQGRFPVSVQGPRPFVRRSQSDRRPSLSMTPRFQEISVAETCGSEPAICSKGLDDYPARHRELWGSQSDLRAAPRSASHPDLCVVGQGLHRS
ncbi:photoreceptor cilium actin regulator [Girardinichthys multiradiatus]|uniref:photoreceptor cilium actin regulator n=1 Tax=Girardinichthys multiradiatus TaxID=208333 RepID=UPI001FABEA43|nr:photoreceptor cilium actin regulator [Girardinichthys multiradiatus]